MTKQKVVIPILLAVAFAAFGTGSFGYSMYERTLGQQSLNWTVTDGRIVESRVASNSGGGTLFYPVIRYRYQADGEQFESERIRFAAIGGSTARYSSELVDQFPVGAAAKVYFNPARPAQSVLQPGVFARSWALLGAGLLCLIFAVICARVGIKSRTRQRDSNPKFFHLGARNPA